ncbi:MAG: PQQ-binding-like beta-propeller repeat protein [Actinotalea sp.]|nr:PQQ-binding-like beta-propeller repeat protein [Actinotalea sp.]
MERALNGRTRALLDGRLVLSGRDRLAALDVRNGETLWEVVLDDAVEGATSPTITDGVRIALTGNRDGRMTLTTFDLASGREVWTTRLPDGTRMVERFGRAVVAVAPRGGGEDFVVLR